MEGLGKMPKPCRHSRTIVATKTGEKPRHICLLCGLILNTRKAEPKRKDASNPQKEKV